MTAIGVPVHGGVNRLFGVGTQGRLVVTGGRERTRTSDTRFRTSHGAVAMRFGASAATPAHRGSRIRADSHRP